MFVFFIIFFLASLLTIQRQKPVGKHLKKWKGWWLRSGCLHVARKEQTVSGNRTQNIDITGPLEAEFPQQPLTSIFQEAAVSQGWALLTWRPGDNNERWRGSSRRSATRPDSTSVHGVNRGKNDLLLLLSVLLSVLWLCSCSLEGKTSWAQPQFGDLNSSMVPIFYVMLPLEEVLGKALHFRPRCIHLIMRLPVPHRYAPCEPGASRTLISLIRQKCWTLLVPWQVTAQFDWLELQEMCNLKYIAAAFCLHFPIKTLKAKFTYLQWYEQFKKTEKKKMELESNPIITNNTIGYITGQRQGASWTSHHLVQVVPPEALSSSNSTATTAVRENDGCF